MAKKSQDTIIEKLQAEIRQLKQENLRLSDTMILLKQQLKREHAEREMHANLHTKAIVEVQMLKKTIAELQNNRSVLEGPVLPRAPTSRILQTTPRAHPTTPSDAQSLEQNSVILASPTMTSILRKKNSNVGMGDQASKTSENDKDNSMTVSGLQTFRDYKSPPIREKSNSLSQISRNPLQNSGVHDEKRSISKRKSYFQKISQN